MPRCPTLGCRERIRVRVERSVPRWMVVWYAVRAAFACALGFLAWVFGSLGLDELQRQFHPGFGRLGAGVQPAPLWESFVLIGLLLPAAFALWRIRRDVYA